MTDYPAWTPPPRQGIVPLHPLGFGTILGRSFTALRQNPRVLLGFAIGVQAVFYLVMSAALIGVVFLVFPRLETLRPDSPDFETILAGSVATVIVAAVLLTLVSTAVSTIVQGVVIAEVAHQVVAEKLRVGALWRRVRPVAWRLIGYALLLIAAWLVVALIFVLIVVSTVTTAPGVGVAVVILAGLAAIPVTLWLSTKLVLVPAAIVMEHAGVFPAIARSWRLTRGRFWPTLGIIVVIAVVMGTAAQMVSIPFSLLGGGLTSVFAPTGEPTVSELIPIIAVSLLTQLVTLLIQAITLVVQATATTLIYVDTRMRKEGLDLDLLAYVEQREAGRGPLVDPYLANIGVDRPSAYVAPAYVPPGGYPPMPPGYGPYGAAPAHPPQQAGYAPPPTPAEPYAPAAPSQGAAAYPPAPQTPEPPAAPPASTQWAAPGAAADEGAAGR